MTSITTIYLKQKQLIPTLILAIICIFTLATLMFGTLKWYSGEIYNYTITSKHYGAFVAVTINLILYFAYRPLYKYTLSATLLLGLFNIINFTVAEYKWSTGFTWLNTGEFQPTSFFVGLITFTINIKRIAFRLAPKTEQTSEQIAIERQKEFNADVEKFKNIYHSKSSEDLIQIIADRKYTATALAAAQQIIDERQSNNERITT